MSKLPETGPSLMRRIRYNERQALRQAQSSAFTRSGASVSSPGMLSSDDFDGTDRTHLGTTGWALGSDDGGPSYFVLNGRDVFKDLTAKDDALAAQDATLTAQQAYLSSLISKDAELAGFNTGTLTNDGVVHYVGATAALTIAVPTGKLRVIISCPQASVNPGTGSGGVEAYLSFSLAGPTPVAMGYYTSRVYTSGPWIGSGITRVKTMTLTPGTYTVTVQAGYFCNGFAAASINFSNIDLSAEVVNGS